MATSATIQFQVEEAGPCRRRVKVTVPEEKVSKEFENSYRQWIKTVPIRGFRPGHAPRGLVEKRFGKQISAEVRQTLIDTAVREAVESQKLSPISDPEFPEEEIEVTPDTQLDFDFTITVKPEFELPDLKEIEVAVPPADPTEKELESTLHGLRKRAATLRPLSEGTIQDEDRVTLKVRGRVGEEELFHKENLPYLVGSQILESLITNGLDEALQGKQPGDVVSAKAFAPPYVENHPLAGQDLEIEATVLEIKRPDLPPLDDAFARTLDFDGLKELREAVRNEVRRRKEQERDRAIEELALAQLIEKVEFTLPEQLIEREADDLARRAAYELQIKGESEEEIAKRVAEIRSRRSEESTRELKAYFLLEKIVETRRILVTENEVRDAVAQIAAYNDRTPEQMYAILRDQGRLGSLRQQLREKKARAELRGKVKVADAPAEKEEGAECAPPEEPPVKKTAAGETAEKKSPRNKAKDA